MRAENLAEELALDLALSNVQDLRPNYYCQSDAVNNRRLFFAKGSLVGLDAAIDSEMESDLCFFGGRTAVRDMDEMLVKIR